MFFFRNKPLIALFGSDDCTGKKEVTYGSSRCRPSLGHPVREVGDAKGGDHTDKTIREFGKCAVTLRTMLH